MSFVKSTDTTPATISAEPDLQVETKKVESTSSNNNSPEENIQQKAIEHMMAVGMMDYYSMRMMFG